MDKIPLLYLSKCSIRSGKDNVLNFNYGILIQMFLFGFLWFLSFKMDISYETTSEKNLFEAKFKTNKNIAFALSHYYIW